MQFNVWLEFTALLWRRVIRPKLRPAHYPLLKAG